MTLPIIEGVLKSSGQADSIPELSLVLKIDQYLME